jgi:subfamily B ATP-binding cassette protein MsbA
VFSFAVLIPILEILFEVNPTQGEVAFIEWSTMTTGNAKDVLMNNLQYYISGFSADNVLLLLGGFLVVMTLL